MNLFIYYEFLSLFAVPGLITIHMSIYGCGERDDYCTDDENHDDYQKTLKQVEKVCEKIRIAAIGSGN